MFIGRGAELKKLNELYAGDSYATLVFAFWGY
jgi:hypothetical protein